MFKLIELEIRLTGDHGTSKTVLASVWLSLTTAVRLQQVHSCVVRAGSKTAVMSKV